MLSSECPCTPLKMSLPENETTVNLKSASFVLIMILHEGYTHIQSQIKPWLIFGESFTLTTRNQQTIRKSPHNNLADKNCEFNTFSAP